MLRISLVRGLGVGLCLGHLESDTPFKFDKDLEMMPVIEMQDVAVAGS